MPDPAAIPETVFLDTQVFVSNAFDLSNEAFLSLKKHIATGRLKLVLTDITVGEVNARITKTIEDEMAGFRKAAGKSRAMKVSGLPDVTAAIEALHPDAIATKLKSLFKEFLTETKATIVEASALTAETVFQKYFLSQPPFGSGDKKNEFPDAFVVEALDTWTFDNETELIAVSGDNPIRDAFAECDNIHAKKELSELLDHVASDDKKLADFLKAQLVVRSEEIGTKAGEAFVDRSFYVENENGDAEVTVDKVYLDGEPEILLVEEGKLAVVEMRLIAEFTADLSYDDSSSSVYDSEEGGMTFMDRRHETVERKTRLTVEVQVSFDGIAADSFEVEDVTLTKPSASAIFLKTAVWEDYPWK